MNNFYLFLLRLFLGRQIRKFTRQTGQFYQSFTTRQLTQTTVLILSLFITQIQAEQLNSEETHQPSRLVMGFYYPSISNVSSQTDIEISLNYWVQELTAKLSFDDMHSVLYDDIKEMSQAFSNKELDMIIAPPVLLSLYFDRSIMADGFVGVQELGKIDHVIIISSQNVNQPFTGYQGKHLILPKNDIFAEMFLNSEMAEQYKSPYQKVFSQISYSIKHKRMILDVFFGKVDIAVVYESMLNIMLEMNPQLMNKIKVISRFPIKSRNYSYFHKDYPYANTLKKGANSFASTIRGQQILEVFHTSNIDICAVNDLDQFDQLIQANKSLNKNR